MVNPLVHDVKRKILAGTLPPEHRLFLTYIDDLVQNVILITAMCSESAGYLMDLEFYPPDMPMGGLEFAIVRIIEALQKEGCDLLSLGGTYGCKLNSSAHADPEIEKILDNLHQQDIFNDAGNLQFKNKFRPVNKTIFLCRPAGTSTPENVIDIIMLIADPEAMQTSDRENHNCGTVRGGVAEPAKELRTRNGHAEALSSASAHNVIEGIKRSRILSEFGFNPLNIPPEHVDFDLKTDSWAQLKMVSIDTQMKRLRGQLQRPMSLDHGLRNVFPFAHFVLTACGQEAEHIFFKSWTKKGAVLQNLLFPSTIFHEIDNGFSIKELPNSTVFDLSCREPYKGNMDYRNL